MVVVGRVSTGEEVSDTVVGQNRSVAKTTPNSNVRDREDSLSFEDSRLLSKQMSSRGHGPSPDLVPSSSYLRTTYLIPSRSTQIMKPSIYCRRP